MRLSQSAVATGLALSGTSTAYSFHYPANRTTGSRVAVPGVAAASPSGGAGAASGFQFLGVNESGAEFGESEIPGVLDTDYTWPDPAVITTLQGKGFNTFRIPHLMERLAQGTITAAFDETYLADLTTTVTAITGAGAYAVIDPHNFGRYNGEIITSADDFGTYWTNLATAFASDANVIFDCNNEFHDEPSNELVLELNQACIDAIRGAGATEQYIFVEGTSWSGAWTWISSGNGDTLGALTDPSDKIVYEMHQYLDSDGSGTSDVCVSETIGAERVAEATEWLQTNGKVGIIGEFAGGANPTCQAAVTGLLDALSAASDVWLGALWWGGGPWWGDYMYSFEPEEGTAYVAYVDSFSSYAP